MALSPTSSSVSGATADSRTPLRLSRQTSYNSLSAPSHHSHASSSHTSIQPSSSTMPLEAPQSSSTGRSSSRERVSSRGGPSGKAQQQQQGAQGSGLRRRLASTKSWLTISHSLENKGSVARDHLALERTYLAWLRTSLSLASIGVGQSQGVA